MKWKGEDLITIGDLMYKGIDRCDTPEEAKQFMELYRKENQFADENIGYLSDYYNVSEMKRIQKWFGVKHPIFGNTVPTPEEAFETGVASAKTDFSAR